MSRGIILSKPIITDVKKLVEEYESGLSTVQLGKQYNTSATVINGWLKKGGAKMRTFSEAHADFSGEKGGLYNGRGWYTEDGAYLTPDANGYLRRTVHGHPLADKTGRILEHRYQACLKYGVDAVRGKDVHHIDGNNQNNAWDNLIPLSRSQHRSVENNLRATKRKRKP
jgi:hypothetical protein